MAGSSNPAAGIIKSIEPYFTTKAPYQLPPNIKELLVKYIPWINIIILVILAPAILAAIGLGAVSLPFSGLAGVDATSGLTISLLALIVQVVLMIAAIPGLLKRSITGWTISFYSVAVGLLFSLLSFQILSGLIGTAISLYILFQIKSYYK